METIHEIVHVVKKLGTAAAYDSASHVFMVWHFACLYHSHT